MDKQTLYLTLIFATISLLCGVKLLRNPRPNQIKFIGFSMIVIGLVLLILSFLKNKDSIINSGTNSKPKSALMASPNPGPNPSPNPSPNPKPDGPNNYRMVFLLMLLILALGLTFIF